MGSRLTAETFSIKKSKQLFKEWFIMSKRMVHNAKDRLMPITKLPLERIILYL